MPEATEEARALKEMISAVEAIDAQLTVLIRQHDALKPRRRAVASLIVRYLGEDIHDLRKIFNEALENEAAIAAEAAADRKATDEKYPDPLDLPTAVRKFLEKADSTPPWQEAGALWAKMLQELNRALMAHEAKK